MPTLICVPILIHDPEAALADATAARNAGADAVELRIDELFTGTSTSNNGPDSFSLESALIHRLIEECPLPCIVTCRSAAEGGHYDGDEMHRISMYEGLVMGQGVTHPPRYIDLEYAAYTASANIKQKINLAVNHPEQLRDVRTSLILSLHDFTGRPQDLMRRILAMKSEPAAAVLKIAYRARSLRDSLELLDLPAALEKPTIALGIGEFGLLSRILAPKFGGFLTFAALRPTTTTAPGQPTLRDLLNIYRFRSIKPTTRIYGIVGWPVTHSLSPLVHNAGFEAIGWNGVYVPLPIAANENAAAGVGGDEGDTSYISFKATMLELIEHERLDLCGCSITLPHKEHAARCAIEHGWELDAAATAIGAANTLIIDRDASPAKRIRLINTDAPALAACIEAQAGPLEAKRIAILGAGGVARAAAYALASRGGTIIIYNRTLDRAQRLAADLADKVSGKIVAATWDLLSKSCCDILINCTPRGMKNSPDESAIAAPLADMTACPRDMIVMDTVYNPIQTPLLQEATRLGFRTIDGVGMFARQAEMQFEAWTSLPAPPGLFEKLVREKFAAE